MPRFFFHLHHGYQQIPDPEGCEYVDAASAIAQGSRIIRDMLAEDVRHGRIDLSWKVRIVDEFGAPVISLTFTEVLRAAEVKPRLDLPPQR